jgi:hypothetical protein
MQTEPVSIDQHKTPRTTICLHSATKNKIDKFRAPGQCYDGFLCQLIEMWKETHNVRVLGKKEMPSASFDHQNE